MKSWLWSLVVFGSIWSCSWLAIYLANIRNVAREVESVRCQSTFRDAVFFLDKEALEQLPFCGLTYSREDETYWKDGTYREQLKFCYSWANWDNHSGVSVIDLR